MVSLLFAVALFRAGVEFQGRNEELFEAAAMLLAVGILTWMIFWMQNQAGEMQSGMETSLSQTSGRAQIFLISFLAVLREGVELSLFLLAAGFAASSVGVLPGALLGLGAAVLIGALWFRSSGRLSLKRFFQVTNILLLLFATGLLAHAVHELIEVGWLPAIIDPLYDLSAFLPVSSFLGTILAALFSYRPSPALLEVIVFWAYLGIVLWVLYRRGKKMSAN